MTPALICLVIAITDGDTLKALCPGNEQVTVRLAEIDAPEKAQPWGQRSKQHLSDLCYQVEAEIRPTATDRYGRTVARVTCRGKDANLEQVRAGLAWAYLKYKPGADIITAEAAARGASAGLWAGPDPTPPWEWRKRKNS